MSEPTDEDVKRTGAFLARFQFGMDDLDRADFCLALAAEFDRIRTDERQQAADRAWEACSCYSCRNRGLKIDCTAYQVVMSGSP